MKKIFFVLVVFTSNLFCLPVFSQIGNEPLALGLPGDNLNLYAVLDVFKKSPTLEEFERALNDRESHINNLDLNNDNMIDYIEVVANKNNNSFSIVLRVAINNVEYQDVAVIEGHKNYAGKVIVQIIGDEDLYGIDYIVEPSFSETPNPGYVGNQRVIVAGSDVYYVNEWPLIVYLFSPSFSVYVSPWHWGFYPTYWRPWSPVFFHFYWDFHRHYYINNFYRRSSYVRYPVSHSYYFKRRQSSPIVRQYRNEGRYNRSYDGRTYQRPMAPERRAIAPSIQTRPAIPSKTRPSMRTGTPSTRPGTRQERPAATRQPMRSAAPAATRPETRQERPAAKRQAVRPAAPSATRPGTRQERPAATRPSTRPEKPSATRPLPKEGKPSSAGSSSSPSSDKSNGPGNRRD